MSARRISRQVAAGHIHRLHRGVYAVGHDRVSFEGRCMATALALGDEAAVSHQSAGAVWGMLKATEGPIHATVPGDNGRRSRRGITIHRSHTLTAAVRTRRRNIPVTTPARTLRDLRRTSPEPVFRRALRRALDLHLISSDQVQEEDLTRSELERMFLALCRRHRLPQPAVNARIDGYEVDFLWRDRDLIVETDGFRHHGDRAAFEADRARDARLHRRGFRVLRFSYRQVRETPHEVADTLHALLSPPVLWG